MAPLGDPLPWALMAHWHLWPPWLPGTIWLLLVIRSPVRLWLTGTYGPHGSLALWLLVVIRSPGLLWLTFINGLHGSLGVYGSSW